MNLLVAPEARQELIDGAIFYAEEANADLGFAFIAEFERALNDRYAPGARRTVACVDAAISSSPLSV